MTEATAVGDMDNDSVCVLIDAESRWHATAAQRLTTTLAGGWCPPTDWNWMSVRFTSTGSRTTRSQQHPAGPLQRPDVHCWRWI